MSLLIALAIALAAGSVTLALVAPRVVLVEWRDPDEAILALVAPGWPRARLAAARAACAGVAFIALVPLGAWPLGLGGVLVPSLVLRYRLTGLRERAAARSLDILRSTHAALRAGMPLATALRLALEQTDRLAGDPYQRALEAFELNAPFDEALLRSARAAHDPRVAVALEAFALLAAEQLPAARAATVIASVADRLTFEERLAEEVRARTGGMRAQITLLALLVPALALYLVASMPGLAATLATPLGTHVLVPAALAFEVAGLLASRAIVRGVLR